MIVKQDPDVDDVRGVEIDTIEYEDGEFKMFMMDGSILHVDSKEDGSLDVWMEKPE